VSTAEHPSVSVEICFSAALDVVSRPLADGLWQFDTRRRFITSLVTAAVSDKCYRSAYLFLVVVPAHHSVPLSAALAEGSRAECIQTISPCVQVSTRVRTCIPYWRALSGGRCQGWSATPFQFIFIIVSRTWLLTVSDQALRSPLLVSGTDLVTYAPSVAFFRSQLKTHLFNISYTFPCDCTVPAQCTVTLVALDTIIILACLITYLPMIVLNI